MSRLVDLKTAQRIRRQVKKISDEGAGQQITFRRLKSSTKTKPEYGFGNTNNYEHFRISVIIYSPSLIDTQREGGKVFEGKISVASPFKPMVGDEIIWMDNYYRMSSDIIPVVLGGEVYYSFQMERANNG